MNLYTIVADLIHPHKLSILNASLENTLKGNYLLMSLSDFKTVVPGKMDPKHLYLLTDHDEGIKQGVCLSCPIIAWAHEENAAQSLMGTSWLILNPEAISPLYLEEISARFYGEPLTVARTSRCVIRELTMEDLPDLLRLQNETVSPAKGAFFPEEILRCSKNCSNPYPEACKTFLSGYIRHQYPFFGYGLYAIIEAVNHDFLGIAGYSSPRKDHCGNISYAILSPWRRQGYGKEALLPLLELGRDYWGFTQITAFIGKDNTASLAFARACGISVAYL